MGRPETSIDETLLRELVTAGHSDSDIAKRFQVTGRTVLRWRIRRGLASQWRPPITRQHGTEVGYSAGCRCAPCTEAHRIHAAIHRRRRHALTREHGLPAHIPHGRNAYFTWGCRCPTCKAAGAADNAAQSAARKARTN